MSLQSVAIVMRGSPGGGGLQSNMRGAGRDGGRLTTAAIAPRRRPGTPGTSTLPTRGSSAAAGSASEVTIANEEARTKR